MTTSIWLPTPSDAYVVALSYRVRRALEVMSTPALRMRRSSPLTPEAGSWCLDPGQRLLSSPHRGEPARWAPHLTRLPSSTPVARLRRERARRRIAAEELAELVAVEAKIKKATAELKVTRTTHVRRRIVGANLVANRCESEGSPASRVLGRTRW